MSLPTSGASPTIVYAATLTTFKANPMLSKSDVSLGKNNLNWVTCVLYCSTVRLPCDCQFQMAASISFVGLIVTAPSSFSSFPLLSALMLLSLSSLS